jgi:hypothetical protein
MNCPKCNKEMSSGYSAASTGISWVDKSNFNSYAFIDEDLSGAGLKKFFPSKAEYFKAYRCSSCECVLIDHSTKLSRKVIENEINSP